MAATAELLITGGANVEARDKVWQGGSEESVVWGLWQTRAAVILNVLLCATKQTRMLGRNCDGMLHGVLP